LKLLFDQNLSHRLPAIFAHAFPGSSQVRLLGLDTADDRTIWKYAAEHDFCIVTLDGDFAELSGLSGHPPKVVWLRCGNRPTAFIERLIREHSLRVLTLAVADDIDLIEIAP
jgi:predicted nuclease of predicted toxin-antitoxin system